VPVRSTIQYTTRFALAVSKRLQESPSRWEGPNPNFVTDFSVNSEKTSGIVKF
jgi:hypothetical protein